MRFCSLRSWKIEEPSRKTLEAAATDIPLNTGQVLIANGQTELKTELNTGQPPIANGQRKPNGSQSSV